VNSKGATESLKIKQIVMKGSMMEMKDKIAVEEQSIRLSSLILKDYILEENRRRTRSREGSQSYVSSNKRLLCIKNPLIQE
jgi:hypothetical protein